MTRPHPGEGQDATGRHVAHVWGRHLTTCEAVALSVMADPAITVDGVPVWRRTVAARRALTQAMGDLRGAPVNDVAVADVLARLTRREAISPSPLARAGRPAEYALNLTGGAAWVATSPAPGAVWAPVRSSTTTAAEAALAEVEHAAADAEEMAAAVAPEDAAAQAAVLRRHAEALRPAAEAARAALAARLEAETPADRAHH